MIEVVCLFACVRVCVYVSGLDSKTGDFLFSPCDSVFPSLTRLVIDPLLLCNLAKPRPLVHVLVALSEER